MPDRFGFSFKVMKNNTLIHTLPYGPSLFNNPIFPTLPIHISIPSLPAALLTIPTCLTINNFSFPLTRPKFQFIVILFCILLLFW